MRCKCGSGNVSEYDAEQKGQFMHSFVICNDCHFEFSVTFLECHHSYDTPAEKVAENVEKECKMDVVKVTIYENSGEIDVVMSTFFTQCVNETPTKAGKLSYLLNLILNDVRQESKIDIEWTKGAEWNL